MNLGKWQTLNSVIPTAGRPEGSAPILWKVAVAGKSHSHMGSEWITPSWGQNKEQEKTDA